MRQNKANDIINGNLEVIHEPQRRRWPIQLKMKKGMADNHIPNLLWQLNIFSISAVYAIFDFWFCDAGIHSCVWEYLMVSLDIFFYIITLSNQTKMKLV